MVKPNKLFLHLTYFKGKEGLTGGLPSTLGVANVV